MKIGEDAVLKRQRSLQLMKMWPEVFTSICLLLFVLPSCTLIYVSRQPAVDLLGTNWTSVTAAIPLVILLSHWSQYRYGPNKNAIVAGLLIPSLILVFLGEKQSRGASTFVQSLFSVDCHMLPEKAELQLHWEAAQSFFTKCTNDTVANSKITVTTKFVADHFRIQDCADYSGALAVHHRSWTYLQSLEENYACTGFCVPGQQLWSKGPHKDSCSVALSKMYRYEVYPRAEQVAMSMLAVLFATVVGACCW